jgi:hypothetical protein
VEVPHLLLSAVSCLNSKFVAIDDIEVSVLWQFRDDVEWSFDVESEFLVEFTLSWFTLVFINVDDVPLLVDLSMFSPGNDVSVFGINSTVNIHYHSSFVDNEWALISEHVPPS